MPTVLHMARPKEFDPSEAMKEAMGAFWENGYHATSVNNLLSEMKLNRGSLYDTFGDKKTLFLAALAEYAGQRGCLGLKAAVEMAPHDPEVAAWVREVTRERELLVAKVIKRGQSDGEISDRLDARVVARYLLTCLAGLKIMGVSSPSAREVREVVSLILLVLDKA